MSDRLRHLVWQVAKLVATAAVVAAVALAILLSSPRQGDADILWLSSSDPTHTQRFARALDQLGHGPPRVFDVNGNEVYVSDRTTRKRPRQVLRRYQRQFVDQGANRRIHLHASRQLRSGKPSEADRERLGTWGSAMMSGDIVPRVVTEERVEMIGLLRDGDSGAGEEARADRIAETIERMQKPLDRLPAVYRRCGGDPELIEEARSAKGRAERCRGASTYCSAQARKLREMRRRLEAYTAAIVRQPDLADCRALERWMRGRYRRRATSFADEIDAVRSVEAVRDESTGLTHVTAVWSGRGFEMEAAMAGSDDRERFRRERAEDFPLCSGCESGWRFGGSGREHGYANHLVWSDRAVPSVATEYVQMMRRRGWQVRGRAFADGRIRRALGMPETPTEWLQFRRGSRHMTLRIRRDPDSGRTEVTAMESD